MQILDTETSHKTSIKYFKKEIKDILRIVLAIILKRVQDTSNMKCKGSILPLKNKM
jgi:hypothetical protein